MKLTIHRGSKEIGGSCVEIESMDARLLIDLGLPLDAEGDPRGYLPSVAGLDDCDPSLLGVLISHPHQDHFGLLAQVPPGVRTGMGAAARRILTAAAPFMRDQRPPPVAAWNFEDKIPLKIGPFTVTPYLVDHSAYDSYALLVQAEGKSIFYSGDFRTHGRKTSLFRRLVQNPPEEIDVLLLEGTAIGRLQESEKFASEKDIEQRLAKVLANTTGLALIHTSAQNIDRVVSIFKACKRTGRTLIIDLYAATVLEATENTKLPQSSWNGVALFLPQSQRVKVKRNEWFDLLRRHSSHRIYVNSIQQDPEKYVLLFRPLHCRDLEKVDCLVGATYIYSQWEGYWERDCFDELKPWLMRYNIPKYSIHTSGHASPGDLQKLARALKPQQIVPIHTFEPGHCPELFPNVEIHDDGEPWEI